MSDLEQQLFFEVVDFHGIGRTGLKRWETEFDLHQEVKWCRLPAVDEN
jgi:hypothetical protein